MQEYLILGFLVSGFAMAGFREEQVQELLINADPVWFSCQKDSECVAITVKCGVPLAVNEKFTKETEAYLKKAEKPEKPVYCGNLVGPVWTDIAICRKNKCGLKF